MGGSSVKMNGLRGFVAKKSNYQYVEENLVRKCHLKPQHCEVGWLMPFLNEMCT